MKPMNAVATLALALAAWPAAAQTPARAGSAAPAHPGSAAPASAALPARSAPPDLARAPTPAAAARGFACLIEPLKRIELRSPVEARIDAVLVDRGEEVKKGQVIVQLDSDVERAALDAVRYRAVMEGEVQSAQSRLVAAKAKYQRREQLVKEKFIAAQERDDALAEMQVAEANVVAAKDNRRLAALEQQRIHALLEQRRIRSPFNGVVTERLQHAGEIAQIGETARPILKLAQTDPLRVGGAAGGDVRQGQGRPAGGGRGRTAAVRPLRGRRDDRRQGGRLGQRHLRRAAGPAEPEGPDPGRGEVPDHLRVAARSAAELAVSPQIPIYPLNP